MTLFQPNGVVLHFGVMGSVNLMATGKMGGDWVMEGGEKADRGDSMLPCARLCNDTLLAHPQAEKGLS